MNVGGTMKKDVYEKISKENSKKSATKFDLVHRFVFQYDNGQNYIVSDDKKIPQEDQSEYD